MTAYGVAQIAGYLAALALLARPLGSFMARAFEGERTWLHPVVRPLERLVYRLCGVREDAEQHWTQYAGSLLAFSAVSGVGLYALQRLQGLLPLNPQGLGTPHAARGAAVLSPDLALNTSVSFVTNTNWQSYIPETTVSYLVQMAGLAVQNFVSAAAGISVALALIRGFARRSCETVGSFWVDLTRATLYVLLPLSLAGALALCSQGVIQNLHLYQRVATLEGRTQTIAQGPVASQEAIKMLGTNGGGFFNANSCHPYENPTPLANLLEMLMVLLIPAALTQTFGRMVRDTRQGWALFAAMSLLFLGGALGTYSAEQAGNPLLARAGLETRATAAQPGGSMEGKEVRFGIASSALFATITTSASCGAVNAMHDSLTPLGGLVPLLNIQLGGVIFGGVGVGLLGMLMYALLAVFVAGLMVGRTPEYLGKKIEQKEVKMAMLALLVLAAGILLFSAASVVVRAGAPGSPTASLGNAGPHGLSEVLYAYSSGTGNNGSAFAGLGANTPWYNITLGLSMLVGRFLTIIPLLAIAGSLARKGTVAATSGTFPTHGGLFVGLLVGTILILGALTFLPALSLGPIVEHFLMHKGSVFPRMPALLSLPVGPGVASPALWG